MKPKQPPQGRRKLRLHKPEFLELIQSLNYTEIEKFAQNAPEFNQKFSIKENVDRKIKISSFPLLAVVVGMQDCRMLQLVLRKGAQVNQSFSSYYIKEMTALGYALLNNAPIDIIDALLNAGADPNAVIEIKEHSPPSVTNLLGQSFHMPPFDIADRLIEKGADFGLCYESYPGVIQELIAYLFQVPEELKATVAAYLLKFYEYIIQHHKPLPDIYPDIISVLIVNKQFKYAEWLIEQGITISPLALIEAARFNAMDLARLMIAKGASPFTKFEYQSTPGVGTSAFSMACQNSHSEMVDYFLTLPNADINLAHRNETEKHKGEISALIVAIHCNDEPMVSLLLRRGADPCQMLKRTIKTIHTMSSYKQQVDLYGKKFADKLYGNVFYSPLIEAVAKRNQAIILILLEAVKTASTDAQIKELIIAQCCSIALQTSDRILFEIFAPYINQPLLFNQDYSFYVHPVFTILLSNPAQERIAKLKIALEWGVSAACFSAPRAISVDYYLDSTYLREPCNSLQHARVGSPMLNTLILSLDITPEIIQNNLIPTSDLCPLMLALPVGENACAELLNYGADPTTLVMYDNGKLETPISLACRSSSFAPQLKLFINKWRTHFPEKDLLGCPPLLTCILWNNLKGMTIVLDNKDLFSQDFFFEHPKYAVFLTSFYGDTNSLKCLLDHEFPMDFTLEVGIYQGRPFLSFLLCEGEKNLFKLLVSRGADLFLADENNPNKNPFYDACLNFSSSPFYLRVILKYRYFNKFPKDHIALRYLRENKSFSPLVAAILAEDVKLIELLLAHGFDPNGQIDAGWYKGKNPTMVAIERKQNDAFEKLMAYGADLTAKVPSEQARPYTAAEMAALSFGFQCQGKKPLRGITAPRLNQNSERPHNQWIYDGNMTGLLRLNPQQDLIKQVKHYFSLLKKQSSSQVNDSIKTALLHFTLFRFFETLDQLIKLNFPIERIIPKGAIPRIRYLLRHQHAGLTLEPYQELTQGIIDNYSANINLLSGDSSVEDPHTANPSNEVGRWFIKNQTTAQNYYIIKNRMEINFEIITKALDVIAQCLSYLESMPSVLADNPYYLACEHSLFVIGECYQQSRQLELDWTILENLMNDALIISNTTAHEVAENEGLNNRFNPLYVLYVARSFDQAKEIIIETLSSHVSAHATALLKK